MLVATEFKFPFMLAFEAGLKIVQFLSCCKKVVGQLHGVFASCSAACSGGRAVSCRQAGGTRACPSTRSALPYTCEQGNKHLACGHCLGISCSVSRLVSDSLPLVVVLNPKQKCPRKAQRVAPQRQGAGLGLPSVRNGQRKFPGRVSEGW